MGYALMHGTEGREKAISVDGVNLCAIKYRHDADLRNFRYRTGKKPPIRRCLNASTISRSRQPFRTQKAARSYFGRFMFLEIWSG